MKLNEQMETTLPTGYAARGAKMDDLDASVALFNLWSQSIIGEDEITDTEAVRNRWLSPDFDPAKDICLVFSPNGTLAGHTEIWMTAKPPVHPWIWGRVHPDHSNRGIGTFLLAWAEQHALRALEEIPAELRLAPRIGIYHQAEQAHKLFKKLGYHYIRSSYRMRIVMDSPPPTPVWPEGINIRTFDSQTDTEAVFRADQDIFRDHFGFIEEPYKQGLAQFKHHFMIGQDDFDSSLWFLATDKDEIAGICLCKPSASDDSEAGYVNSLGVHRPWRKHGLGLALLQHTFSEFYQRGKRKVSLGVDAQNLTGALRLYKKAGMKIYRQFDQFEKEFRPGKEISVQSLED